MSSLTLAMILVAGGGWVDLTWDTALVATHERAQFGPDLDRTLDQAVAHTTQTLGVKLSRAVKAHVYTRVTYKTRFGKARALRTAAHYRAGMIHINGGSTIDDEFAALVTHEMVHALLDHRGRGTHFPAWFNEGLAERARYQVLGQRTGVPARVSELRGALAKQPLAPLPRRLGLSPAQYVVSWAALVYLVQEHGEKNLLEIVRRVIDGEDFERTFAARTRQGSRLFEKRFRAWAGASSTASAPIRPGFK